MLSEVAQARGASKRVRRSVGDRLRDAVLELAGRDAELRSHSERAWASITFSGSRHTLLIRFAGECAVAAGEAFLVALPDHEFAIAGQLIADASVTQVDHVMLPAQHLEVTCELLMLEEA